MKKHIKRFILILQFLTRIPINIDLGFDEEFHKTIAYFPLVGFILGVIIFLVGKVSILVFDPFLNAIIITLIHVILTGGIHIDGLGDTFDALYSYRDKEKMLEIMKDSRLGTNSLLAILFLILLKIGFIYNLINNNLMWTIVFMPVYARLGLMVLTYKTVSPRERGMGNLFIGHGTLGMLIIATIYSAAIVLLVGKLIFFASYIEIIKVISSTIVVMLFAKLVKQISYKKIDGITGDILGCNAELSELVYLVYIYLVSLI